MPYFHASTDVALTQLEQRLPDRVCYCGRSNCVETFLSGPGLLQTYEALWGVDDSVQRSEDLISADTEQSRQVQQLYLDMLARSLAQVINTSDPDRIVLGGGLSQLSLLYDALPERLPAYLFARQHSATPILAPKGSDDAGVIGAALLCDAGQFSDLQES